MTGLLAEGVSPTYVEFGNDKGIEGYRDAQSDDPELVRYRELDGQRVTRLTYPEGMSINEAFQGTVTAIGYHMAQEGKPTWIESDSAGLRALLCENYGVNPEATKPKTWGQGLAAAATQAGTALLARMSFTLTVLWAFLVARVAAQELRTNAGRDFQARVMGDTASTGTGAYASATYIALTADATAPSAANTTLTGEVASGTLARAAAIYAHTNGTASYTLTKTFTSDQSVVIAKIGVFNASSSGTMVFESLLNDTATLVSGDQLQITETVTL